MPRYRRPRIHGATVFFTVALRARGSDLLVREVDRLRAAVRTVHAARPFGIDAWVVLPDHLHCIWTLPPGDRDFAVRWGGIKSALSRGLPAGPRRPSDRARREKAIWQRRFREHHIRDAANLAAHRRYCRLDPVRHGLVTRPASWPCTSLHRDIRRGTVDPERSAPPPEGDFGE